MASKNPKKVDLVFYRNGSGAEPVLEWLRALPPEDKSAVGQDLMRAQWRWPVGMPLCRTLGQDLWEVRTELPSSRIARVLICFSNGKLAALHAFIKKTQKTPENDLALGRTRKKELES